MFGRRKQTSTRIDTLLGKAANLNGDLEFSGGLHLDGRVNGNVRSNAEDGGALSVSESGVIEGRVEVTNIVMNGTVNGDIIASQRLELGRAAKLTGNVQTASLMIEPGALFEGTCKMIKVSATAVAPGKTKSNGKDEQPLDTTSMTPVKADADEKPAEAASVSKAS